MLYIDQPVQVGFSYDIQTNGTLDLESGNIIPDSNTEGPLNKKRNVWQSNTPVHCQHHRQRRAASLELCPGVAPRVRRL